MVVELFTQSEKISLYDAYCMVAPSCACIGGWLAHNRLIFAVDSGARRKGAAKGLALLGRVDS